MPCAVTDIIQTMIDNYVDIFGGEDHIIGDHNQKRSDDIKMSVNTAGKSPVIKKKKPKMASVQNLKC